MTVPIRNPRVVEQALARLTSAYITKPNVRALVWVYMRPAQELENVFWDILTSRVLKTATMYDLPETNSVFDSIGALVGLARNGLPDIDYKALIYLEVAVNRSSGRTVDWSRFAQILQPWCDAILYLDGSAALYFGVWNLQLPPIVVGSQLVKGTANGIGGVFAYTTWPDGDDFEFTSTYGGAPGEGGWSSVLATTVGGLLVASTAL